MKKTTRRGWSRRTEELVAATPGPVAGLTTAAEIAAAFADAPLFAGMSREESARALAHFDEARFPSGRRVVLEGLEGSDFFLVVAGTASVLLDGWRLATLGPGDFFGEMAVLGDGLRTASVRADTPLHCLVLANGRLEELILEHPQLGINLVRTVIGRYSGLHGRRQPPAVEMGAG